MEELEQKLSEMSREGAIHLLRMLYVYARDKEELSDNDDGYTKVYTNGVNNTKEAILLTMRTYTK